MEVLAAVLAAIIIPAVFLLLANKRRRRPTKRTVAGGGDHHLKLPPGPWQLPVIGSLHHLGGSPLPHQSFFRLSQRYGPVMLLRLGQVLTLVVSSGDAAKEVMKTHDVAFASRPQTSSVKIYKAGGEGIAMATYGDHWRQMRKICVVELLSAKRVQSFQRLREEEVERLVRTVAAAARSPSPDGTVNLSELISAHVADTAVRAIVGESLKDRDGFLRLLDEGIKLAAGFNLIDLFPSYTPLLSLIDRSERRVEHTKKLMFDFIEGVIQEHQRRKDGAGGNGPAAVDLLGVLLQIQRDNELQIPLSGNTIKSVIVDIFAGGSETSSTTMQWAMAEMMRNPGTMAKAQEEVRRVVAAGGDESKVTEEVVPELKYLGLVIKETLRLHPPAPLLLPRECREDCQVLGYDVPKGTMVMVNAWAIARDPERWGADAGEFRPERFEGVGAADFRGNDFDYIPFGAGRRICPGMAFGLANMELALASLLFHFDWELPAGVEPAGLDMSEKFGVAVRRAADLRLRPARRAPSPPLQDE